MIMDIILLVLIGGLFAAVMYLYRCLKTLTGAVKHHNAAIGSHTASIQILLDILRDKGKEE